MKCPKCKTIMRHDAGGYNQLRTENGYKAPELENFSCIICGYYVELIPQTITPQELRSKYPNERKTLGKPGWLQNYIKKQLPEIKKLRSSNNRWQDITKTLSTRDGIELSVDAFTVAYRKVLNHERVSK